LSGIETLVTRSDNINLLSIPFSSNNRGCPMILCVRIKKTMDLVDALLQRIDNIINPRCVCRRLAALRRRPRRVCCRLAALRRRPRRIRRIIGVRCGVQRPRRDVISVRCGAHQQPAAGQPRQEQPADIRRQRQPKREATRAEGLGAYLTRLRRPAEGDRCAAGMVAQQPVERPVAAQGDAPDVDLFSRVVKVQANGTLFEPTGQRRP
jgi:hypothetical protein